MEAGISAGQDRGESTGVFRGLTLKPLCFDEQGQNKYSTGYGSLGTIAYFRVPRWFAILQVVHTVHVCVCVCAHGRTHATASCEANRSLLGTKWYKRHTTASTGEC